MLNTDVSVRPLADEVLINKIACTRGYRLGRVLTIDSATYLPVALIAHTAANADAVAIIAPAVEHFGSARAVEALARAVVLETPTGTVSDPRRRAST
ncbi:hypothetical protein [Nocardia brasiliensis]|uniref:hypothetical protein n=1 Tax=Nocardia brasiliensis TaxID=37326 RepID=UPI002458861F|nr:hypothetical protein [Nocardia brasiliensis]